MVNPCLGARLRGRTATMRSKGFREGSEKASGKGSQKGSEKGANCGLYSKKKGSQKGF